MKVDYGPHGFGERVLIGPQKKNKDGHVILLESEKYKKKKERQRIWMEKRSVN